MRVLFLLLISISSFGQISFEKGYLVDNDGKRKECLIKNIDWKNNPLKFEYKLEGGDSIKQGDVESVKEFQVYGYSKYIKVDVKIDRTKPNLSELTPDKNPIWSQEKLFLKTLIESKASLYSYTEGNLIRFFYSTSTIPIEQLIFKEYLIGQTSIGFNNFYKNQLALNVRCGSPRPNSMANLRYSSNDLKRYFFKYNQCEGDTVKVSIMKKRDAFNFKLTPGFNFSSLRIANQTYYNAGIVNFNNTVSLRIGAELEYVLPFNKNKWSLVLEPTYQTLSSSSPQGESILYNSIEFPIGVRHYFFLSENVKIFLNGSYIAPYIIDPSHSVINLRSAFGRQLDVKGGNALSFGVGCQVSKLSLEVRFYSSRDILSDYNSWAADYRRVAFIFGYKIFGTKTK